MNYIQNLLDLIDAIVKFTEGMDFVEFLRR